MSHERVRPMLDVRRIYAEPAALELQRGQEVVGQWPDAEIVPVESHWNIPEVHGDEWNVQRWVRIKTVRDPTPVCPVVAEWPLGMLNRVGLRRLTRNEIVRSAQNAR